jgi:hypothetical protein
MTLRDKLKPTTSINTQGEAVRFADKSVKVAEEFAIGFAEWCDNNYFRMGRLSFWSESTDWDNNKKLTTKELLEI